MSLVQQLSSNLTQLQQRLHVACARVERSPDEIQIVAVTKYAPLAAIRELPSLGVRACGESRPQQLLDRAAQIPGMEWHLIGHLQRNKVRAILPFVQLIHSVDSMRLLDRIDTIAAELQLRPRVLLEVNIAEETTKDGFTERELLSSWGELLNLKHVAIEGLMTLAPYATDPELSRDVFRRLRSLRDEIRQISVQLGTPQLPLPQLSMGMSGDFEVAIEEGATIIRPGSSLFEGIEE